MVDGLVSGKDVLELGPFFCLLLAETSVGGSTRFFAEQVADRTVWLVKLGTVWSSGGTG